MKFWATTLAISAVLSATLALAEDFQTVKGKVYKDATISRVEADGIVVKTKTGISKIYFVELPKDVQERLHPSAAETSARDQVQSRKVEARGWAGLLRLPTDFARLVAIGAVIIIGAVFLIVRSRSRRQETMRAKSK